MDKLLTQKEACEYLNISRTTILRWEKEGKISPLRTTGKHRRYKVDDLNELFGNSSTKLENRNCLIYSRVSTKKQEEWGKKVQETLDNLEKEDEKYENNS